MNDDIPCRAVELGLGHLGELCNLDRNTASGIIPYYHGYIKING